jgi:plastocyanin
MKLIKHSRFVKIAVTVGLGLTLTLATQAYYVFTAGQEGSSDEQANTTLQVNVGEMYFEQVDSELPRGLLAAKIGDVVEFTNVGNLRHSVTIEALDFDQIINPGETATLVVDKEVDRVQVYCRFHDNHEAILTVTANGGSTVQRTSPISEDADTSDLPVYSHEDAIDKLAYTEVDGVKEFHLTAEHFMWEYAEGHVLESWGYEGQLPGPEIRVTEGDQVRVIYKNELPISTTVHWHGVDVPNEADGVPGLTQDAVEPGGTFIYEFTAEPAGTRLYHSHGSHHGDEGEQMDMGLAGPLIIEPLDFVAPDKDFNMFLTERPETGIYPINGRIYPNPEIYNVQEGDRVRFRMINGGSSAIHPMHLHGHQFEIVAIDGNPVPEGASGQLRNNQPLTPGETYDIEFIANNPGGWLFHCHDLGHAAGGMITEMHYE